MENREAENQLPNAKIVGDMSAILKVKKAERFLYNEGKISSTRQRKRQEKKR